MSALSELLTNANTDGWSYELIAEKAQARGHRLSRDTAWRYMTGRQAKTSPDQLRALADVLGLRYDKVSRAAGQPADLGPYEPPREANALTQQEREALNLIIRALVRGRGPEPVPAVETHHKPIRRAAREARPDTPLTGPDEPTP